MGDWLDSADWWEADTFIVGFSFGVVGVEFDYWEWVMKRAVCLRVEDERPFFIYFLIVEYYFRETLLSLIKYIY